MKPEQAARTLAMIGTILLIAAALGRLLATYLLTFDERFLPGATLAAAQNSAERSPLMGLYTLSADRRQVSFSRGVTLPTGEADQNAENQNLDRPQLWVGGVYYLDLESGTLQTRPSTPEDGGSESGGSASARRFAVRVDQNPGAQLQILDKDLQQALQDRTLTVFAVSDNGQNLAFAEAIEEDSSGAGRNWTLYAIRADQNPADAKPEETQPVSIQRIVEQSYFADLAWSPDGRQLLYIAPVKGVDEIFRYDFENGQLAQLTSDGRQKREPQLSTDGKWVAYLALTPGPSSADGRGGEETPLGRNTPTPLVLPPRPTVFQNQESGSNTAKRNLTEIYLLEVESGISTRLTDNDLEEFDLGWTASGQILFSVWRSEWPMVSWLYAVQPGSQSVQRVYPPTAIEHLECEPDLWGANQATLRVSVSNSASQILSFPLEISMDRAPLDVVSARSQHRMQRENIRLNPGESRELEYRVAVANDPKIFLAATIESGSEFPLAAAFCKVEPRTLLLPRLRWFGTTLALVFLGYLLSVPWLRHQKNAWLWRMWFLFLVFFAILVGVESAVVLGLIQ